MTQITLPKQNQTYSHLKMHWQILTMLHHFFVENYIRIDLSDLISLHKNSMLSLVSDC